MVHPPAPQVLSPQALADLSGAAVKCTAFAVYSRVQRPAPPPDSPLEQADAEPGEAAPASLPLCSQPLLVLAPQAGQQPPASAPQQQPAEDGECIDTAVEAGPPPQRTLHCCYGRPLPGSSLLPLAFTDSCGELLHAELLDTAAASLGSLGLAGSSTESLAAAAEASSSPGGSAAARRMCRLVLRRSVELLGMLRTASNPPNMLHSLAIAGTDMQPGERQAWRQLLQEDAAASELPPGAELSVVELQAPPPSRCVVLDTCAVAFTLALPSWLTHLHAHPAAAAGMLGPMRPPAAGCCCCLAWTASRRPCRKPPSLGCPQAAAAAACCHGSMTLCGSCKWRWWPGGSLQSLAAMSTRCKALPPSCTAWPGCKRRSRAPACARWQGPARRQGLTPTSRCMPP